MTTIWADWGFLFIAGLVFGFFNSRQVAAKASIFFNRYYLAAFLFQTLFCMPLAIYCYVVFPDWCWMYWVDAHQVPLVWVILAFLGYYLAMSMGFGLAAFAEKLKPGLGRMILRICLAAFLVFLIVFFKRLFFVGSIEEFRAGALPFFARREPLFALLIVGFSLAIAALIYILVYLGKDLDRPWSKDDQANFERRKRIVSLYRVENDVKTALRNSLNAWSGLEYLKDLLARQGMRVILKPNLAGGGKGLRGTQTSPEILAAAIDIIREAAPQAEIIAVESGSIFWWDLENCYAGSGHERVLKEKGVRFVNLSREPLVARDLGGRFGRDLFPALLLQPHVLVDLPVAKTHAYFRMSGAMKNLFGLTPRAHKLLLYHSKGFADREGQIFIDLYRAFTPALVIMDGIDSGEGEGPFGSAKRTDFIITSDDAVCADLVLAEIMGYPVKAVPYLHALEQAGLCAKFDRVGAPVEKVRPPDWKKPSVRILSLLINTLRILAHHHRIKAPAPCKKP